MAILTKEQQRVERLKANRQVIKSYRLLSLDSERAKEHYRAEVRKVEERKKHLTVVKKEEQNA